LEQNGWQSILYWTANFLWIDAPLWSMRSAKFTQ
jgi:hypothetical protein